MSEFLQKFPGWRFHATKAPQLCASAADAAALGAGWGESPDGPFDSAAPSAPESAIAEPEPLADPIAEPEPEPAPVLKSRKRGKES